LHSRICRYKYLLTINSINIQKHPLLITLVSECIIHHNALHAWGERHNGNVFWDRSNINGPFAYFSYQWGSTITNPTGGALTQLGSLCRLLHIVDVCKMRQRIADHFAERLFKSSYNQLLNSHDSEASHIAKYGYSLICQAKYVD